MIRYLNELEELRLPEGEYVIFGSGPLAVRGLRENRDLDVLVTPALWLRLAHEYPVTSRSSRADTIRIGHLQLMRVDYHSWGPVIQDSSELISEAELTEGLPFVRLETLLHCKKLMSGKKHANDVALIQEYLDRDGAPS